MRDADLTPVQNRYLSFVLSGLSETESARRAGYGPAYSKKAGSRVGTIPSVKAGIQKEQAQLREKAHYDVEQAVQEIDKPVIFAYQQKNPMSIAKLLENKGRLFGLYVDRYQEVPVNLKGALEAAARRLLDITARQPCAELGPATVDPALSAPYCNGPGRKGDPFAE